MQLRIPKPAKSARKPKRAIRRKAKRKAKLHDADRLFSLYIRGRDGYQCRACGSIASPQCAHLVSRRYRAVRWEPTNAVCLCAKCHVFFTYRPIEWEDWIDERWPGRLGMLKARAVAGVAKVDYEAVCAALRTALGVKA